MGRQRIMILASGGGARNARRRSANPSGRAGAGACAAAEIPARASVRIRRCFRKGFIPRRC